jgi:hypothetical protein
MKQLIYASAATRPFSAEDLRQLLDRARSRNSVYGLTGMLLYHTGSFLQVLEGDETYVDIIFKSIERDPRHTQTKILVDQIIQRREFEEWSMGFVDTALSNRQPTGLLNYFQLQPLLTLNESTARKYLYFFHTGLCRETLAPAPFAPQLYGKK